MHLQATVNIELPLYLFTSFNMHDSLQLLLLYYDHIFSFWRWATLPKTIEQNNICMITIFQCHHQTLIWELFLFVILILNKTLLATGAFPKHLYTIVIL
jgi:hypothetical protein